ncbi:hypothetical protein [Geomicrobium sp. JCM 19039]|uniref:hypothetical protein n=1 Tax=Geomicrobium sp. JCM 19039 TaxID=1460636 RepID=UPI00045F3FCE|nr:hypothetical protein [Geomicrobium sp. JCM 19039]GAK11389.1 hypothetical protein JCM19039_1082 [Geomicrobium sp. JCM 19039]
MIAKELDVVRLTDGTEGTILEVLQDKPRVYLFEFKLPDDEYEQDVIQQDRIEAITYTS